MKIIVLGVLSLLLQLCKARNINIDVGAQWPRYSTSYVLELSEFLFDLSPSSFWEYVDSMCTHSIQIDDVISMSPENDPVNIAKKVKELDSVALLSASEIAFKKIPLSTVRSLVQTMVSTVMELCLRDVFDTIYEYQCNDEFVVMLIMIFIALCLY